MAADAELPVRFAMHVFGVGCIVDAVTGEAIHALAGAWILYFFALGVGDIVLVFVTGVTGFHRSLGHEDRMIAPMRIMACAAVQPISVTRIPAGPSGGGTTRVVAGQAEFLLRLVQQAAAVGSVGVVTDLTVAAAAGDVRERCGSGPFDLVRVAFAAELVHRQPGTERLFRSGEGVTGGTTSGFKRCMELFAEQAGLGRGVRIMALLAGSGFDRVAPGGPI